MLLTKISAVLVFAVITSQFAFAGNQGTTITGNKTAATTQTQTNTYSWSVQKTLKPNQVPYIIRSGQTIPVDFLLTATRTGPVTNYTNTAITGQVCIQNTGTQPTVGLWLTDQLEQSTDGGTTWTAFVGPTTIPVTDLSGGTSQCYSYSFTNTLNASYSYRNHAVATIDNFSGFEGTAHSINIIAALTITPVVVNVDQTATLADTFTCPTGFTCTLPTTPVFPLALTGSLTTTDYQISLTNNSAACDKTLSFTNTATLTPSTNPALPTASASATIYTGSCHTATCTGTITVAGPGPQTYLQATITGANNAFLDGIFNGWCADTSHTISPGNSYPVDMYSTYQPISGGLVAYPQNLSQINWIINQAYVGQTSSGGNGVYTYGDVQLAVWTLLTVGTPSSDALATLGSYSQARVNLILAAAAANGIGFVPNSSQYVALLLVPVDSNGMIDGQITFVQVLLSTLGTACLSL